MDRTSLERLFHRSVVHDVFGGTEPGDSPLLVLLSGQPGAGKTAIQRRLLEEHSARRLAAVTGDDLRQYHPEYLELLRDAPFGFPDETSKVSGPLVAMCLDWAREHRRSVLLEGTFRDSSMVADTVHRFRDADYEVHAVVVAVSAAVARLSAESRFLDAPSPLAARWTPPEAHRSSLRSAAQVLHDLERGALLDLVRVEDRERSLYRNRRSPSGRWEQPPNAGDLVRRAQQADPSGASAVEWLNRYASVFRRALQRPGYLLGPARDTYLDLQEAEGRIVGTVVLSPHDLHQVQRRHRDHWAPLGQVRPD